jgi:hypothetical protein
MESYLNYFKERRITGQNSFHPLFPIEEKMDRVDFVSVEYFNTSSVVTALHTHIYTHTQEYHHVHTGYMQVSISYIFFKRKNYVFFRRNNRRGLPFFSPFFSCFFTSNTGTVMKKRSVFVSCLFGGVCIYNIYGYSIYNMMINIITEHCKNPAEYHKNPAEHHKSPAELCKNPTEHRESSTAFRESSTELREGSTELREGSMRPCKRLRHSVKVLRNSVKVLRNSVKDLQNSVKILRHFVKVLRHSVKEQFVREILIINNVILKINSKIMQSVIIKNN